MTQPLTHTQRVAAYLIRAGVQVYLQEVMRGTRLDKNQVAGVLHSLVAQEIVEGLGGWAPGRARRFIVRDLAALKLRVEQGHRHGGGTPKAPRIDFGPLIAALGEP